ncbi:hypothetical protein EHV23_00425 [Lautropia dentalis]|uniref:Uncharacterized protein n=1 Tax=Lautropia dentalis TaxID=2490857 RepID=A0A426FQ47_9BURK|nr:hypothetical protein [Lautropia dentalis]RRN44799.1 hypothetical protein EHV23_00425 [Lautropia dentalis]
MVSTRFSSLGQVPQSQVFDSQILHSQALHSADAPDTHASDALDNTHTPGPRAMPRMQSTFASLRGVRPLAAALMAAVLLPACTTLPSQQIPEAMLTPEAVQETSRTDPAGEPYYLNYQVGTIGLTAAFDDGSHTYAEFEQPVPSDLACFDDAGALLGCEAVGNVLAVEGVHKGILLRHGENALFIAPNPKAQAAPPRQLGNTPAWAAHVQARNRVILKTPLRQALERSAGVVADPALNQAAGLRTSMGQPAAAPVPAGAMPAPLLSGNDGPSRPPRNVRRALLRERGTGSRTASVTAASGTVTSSTPPSGRTSSGRISSNAATSGTAAPVATTDERTPGHVTVNTRATHISSAWTPLPFGQHSAQLDAHHPLMMQLGQQAGRADAAQIDLLVPADNDILGQARLMATRQWLQQQGLPAQQIQVDVRKARPTGVAQPGALLPDTSPANTAQPGSTPAGNTSAGSIPGNNTSAGTAPASSIPAGNTPAGNAQLRVLLLKNGAPLAGV